MIETREFRAEDAADVSRILFESFKTFLGDRMANEKPRPPEELARSAGGTHTEWAHSMSFVALDDGKVIGYIAASVDLLRSIGTLGIIGVDPASMAHGAGTALFQCANKFWMSHNVNKIYTCTSSINTRAQRYYARMGFVEEGRRRRHFFDDVDEISLVIYPRRQAMPAPDVSIREAVAGDAPALAAMLGASGELKGWTDERIRGNIEAKPAAISTRRALVAVDNRDGRVVGFSLANVVFIYNLVNNQLFYVDHTRRSQGIGTLLFNGAVADWNAIAPVRKCDVSIRTDQCQGIGFAIHRGFVVEEALTDQSGPGVTEMRLGKFFDFKKA